MWEHESKTGFSPVMRKSKARLHIRCLFLCHCLFPRSGRNWSWDFGRVCCTLSVMYTVQGVPKKEHDVKTWWPRPLKSQHSKSFYSLLLYQWNRCSTVWDTDRYLWLNCEVEGEPFVLISSFKETDHYHAYNAMQIANVLFWQVQNIHRWNTLNLWIICYKGMNWTSLFTQQRQCTQYVSIQRGWL